MDPAPSPDPAHDERLETLGLLNAAIAHEINQPLTAMMTEASAALRWLQAGETDQVRKALARLLTQGERAAETIDSVRAVACREPPVLAPVSLASVLSDAAIAVRPKLRGAALAMCLEDLQRLPAVAAEPGALTRLFVILLTNAAEALDGCGAPAVEIVGRADDAAVTIEVADSGPGITPDMLGRLFEPFATGKAGGMGLGLAIAQAIAQRHGGALSACNGVGGGACFSLALPLAAASVK